jgi:hypothetical protein
VPTHPFHHLSAAVTSAITRVTITTSAATIVISGCVKSSSTAGVVKFVDITEVTTFEAAASTTTTTTIAG